MRKCDWCNLSEEDRKMLLIENTTWAVCLADEQDYIGRCILVLKRHCSCLSELNDDEWIELKQLIVKLEKCFKNTLGAELSNWSCLLNDFYKEEDANPHVHIHVRPRYKMPMELDGTIYEDEEFGHHYKHKKASVLQKEKLNVLYSIMKKALDEYE